MLDKIKENYNNYIYIYNDVIPNINDNNARRFLENSLYLAIFTSFEFFVKHMINDYVNKKIEIGIRYTDLEFGIARKYFLEKEGAIQQIFKEKNKEGDGTDERTIYKAFNKYFDELKSPLSKEQLSQYIRFEFFHKTKFKHYQMIFSQILGSSNFLDDISITQRESDSSSALELSVSISAFKFISDYCDKIRNYIAHQNDNYTINLEELFILGFTFIDIVNSFLYIMNEMKRRYESHNNFPLSILSSENILDSI